MIRFTTKLGLVMLGGLVASSMASGQEPSGAPKGRVEPPATVTSEVFVQQLNDSLEERVNSVFYAANPDALESHFGITLSEADEALRSQLEIAPGQGVVVVVVKPGSLAEQAGLRANDVLLGLGAEKVEGVEKARKILLGLGKEALQVKLIREGKPRQMSLVGPEHGFPAEAAEYWIGVPVSPVDPTLRAHLPALTTEAGLIANDVVKESPAEKAGLKKNDILMTLDGKPLKDSAELIALIQASQGKAVPVELLRAGKLQTVTITPEKRAHPTAIHFTCALNFQTYRIDQAQAALAGKPSIHYEYFVRAGDKGAELKGEALKEAVAKVVEQKNSRQVRVVSPHAPAQSKDGKPIKLEFRTSLNQAERATVESRVEARLQELTTKVDEIRKLLEALRPTEKK